MVASRDARRKAKEMSGDVKVETTTKPIGGEKNGGNRTIVKSKGPKWYPADDIRVRVPSRKHLHKPTRLRKSISCGTVLILLAGRYRGMRVVFLRQLASGLLLVTGPYAVNGIALRRVDQRYVIATSTGVDATAAAKASAEVDDAYFVRERNDESEELMEDAGEEKKNPMPEKKIAMQKKVDAALLPVFEKDAMLKMYLKSKFTLNKGMRPHAMKF